MKKIPAILFVLAVLFSVTACGNTTEIVQNEGNPDSHYQTENAVEPEISSTSDTVSTTQQNSNAEEGHDMFKIEIVVGERIFYATLYDNEAAKKLLAMLPLTLDMSELNGNEKYYYLDTDLPADASRPSGIKSGDLMLYGNSCLVLFYESFSTSYSYTPLGCINDPSGLSSAIGSGSVQVTFQK